jgi:hypothetical protein
MSPNVTDNLFQSELSDISELNIRREQCRDREIRYWFSQVRTGVPPKKENLPYNNIPFHKAMLINFDKFCVKMVFFSEKLEMENLQARNIK